MNDVPQMDACLDEHSQHPPDVHLLGAPLLETVTLRGGAYLGRSVRFPSQRLSNIHCNLLDPSSCVSLASCHQLRHLKCLLRRNPGRDLHRRNSVRDLHLTHGLVNGHMVPLSFPHLETVSIATVAEGCEFGARVAGCAGVRSTLLCLEDASGLLRVPLNTRVDFLKFTAAQQQPVWKQLVVRKLDCVVDFEDRVFVVPESVVECRVRSESKSLTVDVSRARHLESLWALAPRGDSVTTIPKLTAPLRVGQDVFIRWKKYA